MNPSIPLPEPLRAVLFDLDGTLLDSFPVHYQAYLVTFRHYGIQVDEERFMKVYSPDWFHTYRAMGLPEQDWEQADQVWLEHVTSHHAEPFPGVEALLESLQGRYRLALVTSGSKRRVLRDLQRTGLGRFFELTITGDDVQQPKPAPQCLELALEQLGLPPGQAVYVGDTPVDEQTATTAGMAFVRIASKFSPPEGPHLPCVTDLVRLLAG